MFLRQTHDPIHRIEGALEAAIGEHSRYTRNGEQKQEHQYKNRDGDLDQGKACTALHGRILRRRMKITTIAGRPIRPSVSHALCFGSVSVRASIAHPLSAKVQFTARE
jgi:hypothetical protein